MHFSFHGDTLQMLPPWVPLPDAVVVGTGIAEVTIGILMLYGRTRRIAVVGSLVLLILFIPAVFHMLYEKNASPFSNLASLPNWLWRLLIVPHNVLMAICSVHLLRKPYPDPWGVVGPKPLGGRSIVAGPGWAVLLVALLLLLCNAAGFLAVLVGVTVNLPTAQMWMMMCLAVGGLLGFLFAVPRAGTKASSGDTLEPNRNIEAISDWLTKIIIGLGLINFRQIGDLLTTRSAVLSTTLKVDSNYALAFIIYFFVAGLIEGYLLTRIFLQWQFVDAIQSRNSLVDESNPLQKS